MSIYGEGFARVYNRDWAFYSDHVWAFVRHVAHPEARTWLDACCGAGALLAKVCEAGYEASGFDLSHHQLAFARENAPQAELHHADVRTFSLGRRFDVVTCMFDSLNYLTDPPDLALALAGLDTHLAERGSLVFDVNTYEGLEDAWQRTQAIDDVHHTLTIEMSFDATTALGRGLISGTVRDGGACCQFEEEHVERGYRAEEIEAMLDDLGLSFTKYDGDTLEPPGERPGRLLYVCRHEEERRCD